MPKLEIYILPTGVVWSQYTSALAGLAGQPGAVVQRLSNVHPVGFVKRLAFRLCRRLGGDDGRLADWTRRWRGPWIVDFSPSRLLSPELPEPRIFNSRTEALAFESQVATGILRSRLQASLAAAKPAN